jgi:hypothetical protein
MRSPQLALALAASFAAGCATSVEGGRGGVPDATATVTNDFPDAGPVAPLPDAMPAILPCLEGDLRVENPDDGTCYMLLNTPVTWTAGQAACIALGANLAVVESLAEQTLVGTLAAQYPAGNQDMWLGASDSTVEGTFVWVDTTPVVYSNWRSGEPNDNGADGAGEDCAVIEGDNAAYEWDDRTCTTLHPAICER